MKNIFFLILLLVAQFSLIAQSPKNGFILNGNIEGLPNGTSIYLVTKEVDTLAITKSNNSTFRFEGFVDGEANYYFLRLDTNINKKFSTALWLVNSELKLNGKLANWPSMTLTGSEPQLEYLKVKELTDTIKNYKKKIEVWNSFIKNHPNSLYVADLIIKISDENEKIYFYKQLTSRAQKSYYGSKLRELILVDNKYNSLINTVNRNGVIPNFFVTTPKGAKISILEIAAQSKFTLIDFWASWCAPCRAANPGMLKVYESFRNKGFNILSISTDKKNSNWKKALAEDKTPWMHGIDDIENASKDIFDLSAIPAYLLIDKNGEIIQSNYVSSRKKYSKSKFNSLSLSEDLYQIVDSLIK